MEEIEVGEYVRTCTGEIYKYENSIEYVCKCDNFYGRIVKHSKNIIDLIEVGDYVNGEPVEEVSIGPDEFEITTTTEYLTNVNDIESIVTKEQFKSVEYEVK